MGVGNFRYTVWDPILIIAQIVTMQCIMYTSLGLLLVFLDHIIGVDLSLDQIFRYQEINIKSQGGCVVLAAFFINSLCCAVGLWWVVQRTKQCLDFSATVHLFHLLGCLCYCGHLPPGYLWWAAMTVCATIMCVSGEFLCMRTELRPITLAMGQRADL